MRRLARHQGLTRRQFITGALAGAVAAALPLGLAACGGSTAPDSAAQEDRQVGLSGPPMAETLPLLRLAARRETGRRYGFTPWQSPDQLRALISGGQADAAVLSLTAAATLRVRGLPVRVAALSSPPLWIVSSAPGLRTLDQLAGQELCLPFGPGEFPDLLLRALAGRMGVAPLPRHAGGGFEVVNLLLAGRARHAFLSEPAASLALRKAKSAGGILFKAVDVHAAWAAAFPESPALAHGAFALIGGTWSGADERASIRRSYVEEARAVADAPQTATALAEQLYPDLARTAEDGVVPGSHLRVHLGAAAEEGARFLLARLLERSPQAFGGALPDADFLELGA